MSTGDPICESCGNYKSQCICGKILKNLNGIKKNEYTKYLEILLDITKREKITAIRNQEYEKAGALRTTEENLLEMIEQRKMNLNDLKYKAADFSDRTFGVNNPIIGPLTHIHEEIDEVIHCLETGTDPLDEFADCFLMLVDAFRKHYGNAVDMQTLIDASSKKLDINETRKWGKPDKNGVVKHIKEPSSERPSNLKTTKRTLSLKGRNKRY